MYMLSGLKLTDISADLDAVEEYPDGYPRLAAFLNSDISTRLYYRWE